MEYIIIDVHFDLEKFLKNKLDKIEIVGEEGKIDFTSTNEQIILDERAVTFYDETYKTWDSYINLLLPQKLANTKNITKFISENKTKILKILLDDLKNDYITQEREVEKIINHKNKIANKILDITKQM